jgi:hypothetical protein
MTDTLLFFLGGRAERDALVVKVAVEAGRRNHGCCEGRRARDARSEVLDRHRQQVWRLIVT